MAKNTVAQLFSPAEGWFLRNDNDHHWDVFSDPSQRTTLQPRRMSRTLWSVTPCTDRDGKYYGDAIIRGYSVVRKVVDGISDLVS